MNELRAQLQEWRASIERVLPSWWPRALAIALIVFGLILPQLFSPTSNFINTEINWFLSFFPPLPPLPPWWPF